MVTAAAPMVLATPHLHRRRIAVVWSGCVVLLLGAAIAATLVGAAHLPVRGVLLELVDRLPFVRADSGLDARSAAVLWQLRLPRIVLAMLVGAMLSMAGAAYQGVFRNPLADPYLLGSAAGAGLGATIVITLGWQQGIGPFDPLPLAAFAGAFLAVGMTYVIGFGRGRVRSTASLLLAGVAVTSMLTALQTYAQQRDDDTLRQVYAWILGRLSTAGWEEVVIILPWAILSTVVVLAYRRSLDVLSVGDEEARTLGLNVDRTRLIVVAAASLGTAAAVSVSGLIAFVGIIVPHTVRLLTGSSYRRILPLSLIAGAAFLVLADLAARTALSPGELPIGVVTALIGGPFFLVLLGRRA